MKLALDLDQVDAALNERGYFLIRDAALKSLSVAARSEYDRCLRTTRAHAPSERFDYRALSREPWRKMAIGSRNGIGESYAQNLQTTYFDSDDKNYPAISSLFKIMLSVRNQLMKLTENFGQKPQDDRFWNACRIHHYPRGGGFMVMHKDSHFPQVVASQMGKPYYQIQVLLSRKTVDFMNGGGFVISGRGEKVDLETEGGLGAMVIFDGRTDHGVDDIDTDEVIDFSKPDGRLAAFVNLYSAL